MIELPMPTETSIRERTTDLSFEKGVDYLEEGAVVSLVRRGDFLHAQVEDDAELRTFRIEIRLEGEDILWTRCSCESQDSGDCRHVVSVLLTCARCPEDVEHRPSIETQLAGLSAADLRELWMELIEQKTYMIEWLDESISVVLQSDCQPGESAADASDGQFMIPVPATPPPSSRVKPRKKVDPEGVRWHVNATIHSLDRMRSEDAQSQIPTVLDDLRKVLEEARGALELSDPQSALLILEAMIDVWSEEWEILDDDSGLAVAFWDELELPLAEAVLSLTLSETERDEWYGLIEAWQDDVAEHEFVPLTLAHTALEEGWDDEEIKAILKDTRGVFTPETMASSFGSYRIQDAEELALVRLSVLKRIEDTEGYLRFAWAAGLLPQWAAMMVQRKRPDEVVTTGLAQITTPAEALAMARCLHDADYSQEALTLIEATAALAGEGHTQLLAFGRDLAERMEDTSLAFAWGVEAFYEAPTFSSYRALEELENEAWEERQQELLHAVIEGPTPPKEAISILLHAHMLDEVVELVDKSDDEELIEHVVDALWARRPGWALEACQSQITPILEQGLSHRYDSVRAWLNKACDAAEAHGTLREFKAYLEELLSEHSRKHKLTPHLRELIGDVNKLIKKGRRSLRVLLAMRGKNAADLTPDELQKIQIEEFVSGGNDSDYDAFLQGLSAPARAFLELLEQSGYLQAGEAKESLGIETDRQIGGLVGSIKRRANKYYMQPPYMTGLTDAGERFWRWIGRKQE